MGKDSMGKDPMGEYSMGKQWREKTSSETSENYCKRALAGERLSFMEDFVAGTSLCCSERSCRSSARSLSTSLGEVLRAVAGRNSWRSRASTSLAANSAELETLKMLAREMPT
jgi:hypothetical protein